MADIKEQKDLGDILGTQAQGGVTKNKAVLSLADQLKEIPANQRVEVVVTALDPMLGNEEFIGYGDYSAQITFGKPIKLPVAIILFLLDKEQTGYIKHVVNKKGFHDAVKMPRFNVEAV